MPKLSVNIDHVATIRQARKSHEPDPVWAAIEAQLGGADGITVHLREDRRHIQDHDIDRLKSTVHIPLNLEMAATPELLAIALKLRPAMAMFVPEKRTEVTTEGGLDVHGQKAAITTAVKTLRDAGIPVSAFIDPDKKQIDAAADAGFSVCEIHTGAYALGHGREQVIQYELIHRAGHYVVDIGLQFNAGHGLNYTNIKPIAALPNIAELHIGHAIISHAVFTGLREAVKEMKRLIELGALQSHEHHHHDEDQ